MKNVSLVENRVDVIKKLFQRKAFFTLLANYSDNDINKLTENIGLIIDYYLNSNDSNTSYSLEELFNHIKDNDLTSRFLLTTYNGFYKSRIKLMGLNCLPNLFYRKDHLIEELNKQVSVFSTQTRFHPVIYKNSYEALLVGFTEPFNLFNSLLKEPTIKRPFIVGETSYDHYAPIMETRLKNARKEPRTLLTKLGKDLLETYLDESVLICVINPDVKKEGNLCNREKPIIYEYVKPSDIGIIEVPSYYELMSICASNKELPIGTLLDMQSGKPYKLPKTSHKLYSSLSYSNYELVTIDENFNYTNPYLTGDPLYDIDLIYGALDSNESREALNNSFDDNLMRIKASRDIKLELRDGKYDIKNGRHRLIYLKWFYQENYEYYKRRNELPNYKRIFRVPVEVDKTIEDDEINSLLIRLERKYSKTKLLKVDISNSLPDILIIINDYVYHITSKEELLELIRLLDNNEFNNRFFIDYNYPVDEVNGVNLIRYLTITIGVSIYDMNLMDIINYIKEHDIIIDFNKVTKINYSALYVGYAELKHVLELNKIRGTEDTIMASTQEQYDTHRIGRMLRDIIATTIIDDESSWEEVLKFLITIEPFSNYTIPYLDKCAEANGCKIKFLKNYHDKNNTF